MNWPAIAIKTLLTVLLVGANVAFTLFWSRKNGTIFLPATFALIWYVWRWRRGDTAPAPVMPREARETPNSKPRAISVRDS